MNREQEESILTHAREAEDVCNKLIFVKQEVGISKKNTAERVVAVDGLEDFWRIWKESKMVCKVLGYYVRKDYTSGQFYVYRKQDEDEG